ncbi:MAG: hypothetical protein AVDCRST_MAG71-2758, partial [uncultured Lysobacter sp.]
GLHRRRSGAARRFTRIVREHGYPVPAGSRACVPCRSGWQPAARFAACAVRRTRRGPDLRRGERARCAGGDESGRSAAAGRACRAAVRRPVQLAAAGGV